MTGRYGHDQLNFYLLILDVLLLVVASIFSDSFGRYLQIFVWLLLAYIYFRMFSRNIARRREEYGKFVRLKLKISAFFRVHWERWIQRRDYKFFTCPSCKAVLRVPRGHGKIKVVCRRCGNSFIGKS